MPHQNRSTKTGAKCRRRLRDIHFGTGNLSGVPADEMIHRLLGSQLGNRGQHAKRITRQKDNVLWLRANTGNLCIVDELNRISHASIFSDRCVIVIDFVRCLVKHHVFKHGTVPNGVKDLRLTLLAQVDHLGVATAFDVEYTIVSPAMLVIPNQLP